MAKAPLEMPGITEATGSDSNSREAVERILTTTLDNISGFLEGTPRNRAA